MAVCESFAINFKHLVFGGTSNSWISRSSFSDDIAHLQVYSRTQMKNTMCDILAYQGRVAGSLILFWLRLPHPALPCLSFFPRLPLEIDLMTQGIDWMTQCNSWIYFSLVPLSFFWRFINCLNWRWQPWVDRLTIWTCTARRHWCLKRQSVRNSTVWHVRVLRFHSDVRFFARRFLAGTLAFWFRMFFRLVACVAIGVCN